MLAGLVAGVLGGLVRGCGDAPQPGSPSALSTALPLSTPSGSLSGSVAGAAAPPSALAPGAPGQPAGRGQASVRYTFDSGSGGTLPEAGGRLPLRERGSGGTISTVDGRSGRALLFPGTCKKAENKCPRAILESGPAAFLNPGMRDIRFGASVRMRPDQTSKGANVLQKGYSVSASEYKLQVDGEAGRPSCVLVGTGSPRIHLAVAQVTVADGLWHTVDCARTGGFLTIAVDSVERGRIAVPHNLSVTNDHPLRLGGKGLSPNNDQFHGAIDDAYVTVGAA